MVSMLSGTGEL